MCWARDYIRCEVGNARGAHEGHAPINLAAENFKDLRNSGFSSDRKTPELRTGNKAAGRTEAQGFHHIASRA